MKNNALNKQIKGAYIRERKRDVSAACYESQKKEAGRTSRADEVAWGGERIPAGRGKYGGKENAVQKKGKKSFSGKGGGAFLGKEMGA